MRATCPKSEKHKQFITAVFIEEDWFVDERGNKLRMYQSIGMSRGPDSQNDWTCAECGADAIVVDD